MRKSNLLIILVGCFLFINCLKEENADITITLQGIYNSNLGKKGTIAIFSLASADFTFTDTSKSIKFQSKLKNQEKEYQVNCGFWKPGNEKYDFLYTFCNYDENIPAGNYILDFSGVSPISIPGYTITLKTDFTLHFTKSDVDIVDIYSGKQTINVEEGKDNYELRFKIISYHQEPIMILSKLTSTTFIDCFKQNEELVCKVTKNQIESILSSKEEKIYVSALDYHSNGRSFDLVPRIAVNYNLPKTDIYLGITKLIENVAECYTLIAYETNVTDITNVLTDLNAFQLEFINSKYGKLSSKCSFRKYNGFPLLILCNAEYEGTNVLNEITEEKIYNNINIKYNFRIQPVKNEEKIEGKQVGSSYIRYNYPYTLDFTKSDSLSVNYHIEPNDLTGLTFNENKGDLTCQTILNDIKKCTVPKSHFDGKKTGYYFLKHNNHLNGKSTTYESYPVKVILDGPGFNKVSFALVYSLLLILIMF